LHTYQLYNVHKQSRTVTQHYN